MFGKDMFVSKRNIPGGTAYKGDAVRFSIAEDGKGGYEATQVKLDGKRQGGKGQSRAQHAQMPMQVQAFSAGKGANGASYVGSVKSFNAMKGWGMIECNKTFAQYGKDMFFLRTDLPTGHADPGQRLRFNVFMDFNGPKATNIQLIGANFPAVGTMQRQPVAQMQKQIPFMIPFPSMPMAAHKGFSPTQIYFGVVKSFNAEKGWGFITCEA